MLIKKIKQHIPLAIAGICCWVLVFFFAGTLCPVRQISGLPCPGCGTTRAVLALLRGDIRQALEFHPLIFITLAAILIFILAYILRINIWKFKYANALLYFIFSIYIIVYIIRMILFFPHTEPMTYLEISLAGRLIFFIISFFWSWQHVYYKIKCALSLTISLK